MVKKRRLGVLGVLLVVCVGCASLVSSVLNGGRAVPAKYQPQNIIVSYRLEGVIPKGGIQIHLVETERGMAIFEQSKKGMHGLIETRWTSSDGDHFAAWVDDGHAFEYIVPRDRSKNAGRYVYMPGTYKLHIVDGIERPVPKAPKVKPDTVLIPK